MKLLGLAFYLITQLVLPHKQKEAKYGYITYFCLPIATKILYIYYEIYKTQLISIKQKQGP